MAETLAKLAGADLATVVERATLSAEAPIVKAVPPSAVKFVIDVMLRDESVLWG